MANLEQTFVRCENSVKILSEKQPTDLENCDLKYLISHVFFYLKEEYIPVNLNIYLGQIAI